MNMPELQEVCAETSQCSPISPSAEVVNPRENPFLLGKLLQFVINLMQSHNLPLAHGDFFEPCVNALTSEGICQLVAATCSEELLTEMAKSGGRRNVLTLKENPPEDSLCVLWNRLPRGSQFKKQLLESLQKKAAEYHRLAEGSATVNLFQQRFSELVRVFELDARETDMLLLSYLRNIDLWKRSTLDSCRYSKIQTIGAILQIPFLAVAKILADTGKLRKYFCIDKDYDINEGVDAFLAGLTNEPFVSRYFTRHTEDALPWAMHGKLAEEHGEVLKALLAANESGRGISILLYGEPGTG